MGRSIDIADGSSAAALDADRARRKIENTIMKWEGEQVRVELFSWCSQDMRGGESLTTYSVAIYMFSSNYAGIIQGTGFRLAKCSIQVCTAARKTDSQKNGESEPPLPRPHY